ncbi:uncharacterized protein KZ484_012390 [Pholidichthys leucotaenia]
MGNKTTSLRQNPETGAMQEEEGPVTNSPKESISRDGPQGPSPELLASLQSLGDNSDDTLLPHSLHQIAEAYSLKEDYQWAIQFLQLEKLYHQRLLANLAALQENWESQWKEKKDVDGSFPAEVDSISQKVIETLIHICTTHLRPSVTIAQKELNTTLKNLQLNNEVLQSSGDKVSKSERTEKEQSLKLESKLPFTQPGLGNDGDGGEEDTYEEGQEVDEEEEEEEQCEETPEEEVKVEWPAGVPQASDKDLAKLSNKEGNSSPEGLVSILKRRRASLDGLPPPSNTANKNNSKRKVRFSEPEDGIEQDEVGGDSCLILLLLCLVTVVISIGGTALYCTLVGTYSSICTDFTDNVNFYIMTVRRFLEGLGRWLPLRT